MAFDLKIEPRAYDDIENALDYYFEINPKLAEELNHEINRAYALLANNPFFQVRYKDYRALPIIKFPYAFYYVLDEVKKEVTIYSLFHTHQDPEKRP